MNPRGVVLTTVRPGSPAARAGLRAGDRVLAVDGLAPEDALDVMVAIAEERFEVGYGRGGRRRLARVSRRMGQDWGARLEPPPLRRCGNRCRFCFVDQMPPGLRPSLYVKDEDYRHSFLYGNYVTMSNVSGRDVERIKRLRLSPLYISVHATDERVRRDLLGRARTLPILPLLKSLTAAGIVLHTQAVVCPGVNDGRVLEKTVSDLGRLRPGVRSLAIVPVGLSGHRAGLPVLRAIDAAQAAGLVKKVRVWQEGFRRTGPMRFVYATDEWYLRAGLPVPAAGAYDGFPQIENGVGIVRQFLDGCRAACRRLPARATPARRVLVPVGILAAGVVERALKPLARMPGVSLEVVPVPNRLFGESVTVTGLLGGADLAAALAGKIRGATRVLIAGDMVRDGEDVFLDDLSLGDLGRSLHARVKQVNSPAELVRAVFAARV
jgi:putative radical SAM enzyme (TIGR03279 family)